MATNQINMYDLDPHIAEIYDQSERYDDDVQLLRSLLDGRGPLRVLEPFCGTGRILIPLALDGHAVLGIDGARGMLERARAKIAELPAAARARIELREENLLTSAWPQGFDLVVLGGNCLYELGVPEEQEHCIAAAAASLRPGGLLYLDNNHMEGPLAATWQLPGERPGFPTGTCADGTVVTSTWEPVWFDVAQRLIRYRRRTLLRFPDGTRAEHELLRQTHPVSTVEVRAWLGRHGFDVARLFGSRGAEPYTDDSARAIFWAVRRA